MNINTAIQKIVMLSEEVDAPFLMVMIGAPGSGKSTFLNKLKVAWLQQFVAAGTDKYFDEAALAQGKTYSEVFATLNFKELNAKMNAEIAQAILFHKHLAIDRTHMGKKSRKGYLQAQSYYKIALNFTVDDKVLQDRLRARGLDTGKIIPDHVMHSMFNNYERPTREEGFDLILEIDNTF